MDAIATMTAEAIARHEAEEAREAAESWQSTDYSDPETGEPNPYMFT